jgi:hypothetical protein
MPSSLSPSPSRNSRRRESSSSSSPTRKIGGASLGDGYKTWLQRAIRVEEESDPEIGDNLGGGGGGGGVDWTPHTIDYALFKSRLKFFAHRRAQLRYLLRESGDQRLSKTVLDAIVEPQPKRIDFRDTNAAAARQGTSEGVLPLRWRLPSPTLLRQHQPDLPSPMRGRPPNPSRPSVPAAPGPAGPCTGSRRISRTTTTNSSSRNRNRSTRPLPFPPSTIPWTRWWSSRGRRRFRTGKNR